MNGRNYDNKDLLRFLTCGSVDDGKSTLIGRLLCDSKKVFRDQMKSLRQDSAKFGSTADEIDYALLMDGLTAEREQGITIDVAYRYFETAKRKFIIADTPGHTQYTRNMVTGASTADLAVVLVDARNGVGTQSKRHTFLVSLLQIPHLVVAVNKMDAVDYSRKVFDGIVEDFKIFFEKLDIHDVHFLPVSALKGDNVVNGSRNMPWYQGLPLLNYIEDVYISADRNLVDFRFPVQYVIRADSTFRGYAGRIESGTIKPGEEVVVLPSGMGSTIESIQTYDGCLPEAFSGQSVALTLSDEIDISRGDMIVRKNNLPDIADCYDAMLCWMAEGQFNKSGHYLLKHTTRTVKAFIEKIMYKVDVDTLHRVKTGALELNDIARVEIRTARKLFTDPYRENRQTGSFILIDPVTNFTVAAGMFRGIAKKIPLVPPLSENYAAGSSASRPAGITRELREERNQHKACVIWLTGHSGLKKTMIAAELEKQLFAKGCRTVLLDDNSFSRAPGFDLAVSSDEREKIITRAADVAKLFFDNGALVICLITALRRTERDSVRKLLPAGRFYDVFVRGVETSAETAVAAYEEPETPEITVNADVENYQEICDRVIAVLADAMIIP